MKKAVPFFMAALCAAVLFSGCSFQHGASSAAQSPANSSSSHTGSVTLIVNSAPSGVTQSSSQGSSKSTASSEDLSTGKNTAGNPANYVTREKTASQGNIVKPESTDSSEFNKKFKDNPVDKHYVSEINNAVSNIEIVKVSDKYAGLWEKEIVNAYSELKNKAGSSAWKQIEADQKNWENGKAAAIQKISEDAKASGGSMAQAEAASGAMDYYRDRAAQLYRRLFDYDKNYSYAFSTK
ncbi:MAG TPA: hypothetical protein DG942_00125 [Ruminococcaceae bacterium]|jgi:uncharacterized protein YecT (DUF1311 family)|nr:hypothetical protein [Oscillospiraceae bacterium]